MKKYNLIIILAMVLLIAVITSCSQNETTTTIVTTTTPITTNYLPLSPYPPERIPPPPQITEAKAISTALHFIPSELILTVNIRADYLRVSNNGAWSVTFNNISLTKEQLLDLGWNEDDFLVSSPGPYDSIAINIDAINGSVFSKYPYNSKYNVVLGFPPHPGLIPMDKAITIASRYIPVVSLITGQMVAIPEEGVWVMYFVGNVTPDQLGWQGDSKTHLDKLLTGQQYFELAIMIDGNTGELIQRAAFAPITTTTTSP